ncbi:MAG: hypothetical protein Q4B50_04660 [Bacillota bacterium]|nr:hypothetical protein [Bacillota bacterium]
MSTAQVIDFLVRIDDLVILVVKELRRKKAFRMEEMGRNCGLLVFGGSKNHCAEQLRAI